MTDVQEALAPAGGIMERKMKILAKVQVLDVATPEELTGIKNLLEKAGLIVVAKGRELWVSVRDNAR